MSKRPNSSSSQTDQSTKRHQTQDPRGNPSSSDAIDNSRQALIKLAEQADELVDCLQSLKKQLLQGQDIPESRLNETKKQASRLSKNLLPSFEALANEHEHDPGAPEHSSHDGIPSTPQHNGNHQSKAASGVSVLSAITVTPWVSSEITPEWPTLPPILDPAIAEEVFTHPGLGRKRNYERLEWLGDAYLELIATALIHQTFLKLPSGRCSQLRERLIRNVNLAEYFRHYGMSKWAKLPGDFSDGRGLGRGRSNDKDLLKTQADMFEAYVAGVILSDPQNGLTNVVEWLKALWGRTIEEDIKKAEAATKEAETPKAAESSAKERLGLKIVVKGVAIRYKDLPCEKRDKSLGLPLYSVGAYLDGWGEVGRLLAVGTALSKKEAGQKAAETALQNKRLIKVYEEKKRAYLQARGDAT